MMLMNRPSIPSVVLGMAVCWWNLQALIIGGDASIQADHGLPHPPIIPFSMTASEILAQVWNVSAPFFGAAPPLKHPLPLHRRGWEACNRCGGAERLGAMIDVGDVTALNSTSVELILDAVRAHGMIVIKGQNLSRAQQVEFTSRLGEVVVLPTSFEGKDPEPFHPAIQRITNFWANGTWKGPSAKFGAYWHQDGQFWVRPRHYILSVLHAQATPPKGGETGFADLRAAFATLSRPLLERAAQASIEASVRDIADFSKGTEEDLAAFPEAHHAILDVHALDGGTCCSGGRRTLRSDFPS